VFTSRSAVESYQDCPRYRYNQFFLMGKGVVAKAKSIPLVTGSAIHRGVEHLMCRIRLVDGINEADVTAAVHLAVKEYVQVCEAEGFRFSGKGTETDKQQWFTFGEQKALIEALIRVWALVEAPIIIERYKVVHVERDIEPLEIAPDIWFQAKVDAEMVEKSTGAVHNYSLKSMKQWDDRSENSYRSDLQGVTEIWAVDSDAVRRQGLVNKALHELDELSKAFPAQQANFGKVHDYLKMFKPSGKQVSAVRFCVLIKGARYAENRDDPNALLVTHNSLIRGYKNVTPSGIAYAHSMYFPNPTNKSGKGRLGVGWVPFNVWEEMGVDEWIRMLAAGSIQPECGDVLPKYVFSPLEYYRSDAEIDLAMEEIIWQEERIQASVLAIKNEPEFAAQELASTFPHVRKHCEFHFGGPCEYKELCWNPAVANDPIGSELYQIRMPHHEAERR